MVDDDISVARLRAFGDQPVRVRLADRAEFTGRLRVDLLTERSISVLLERGADAVDGAVVTLYIDDITGIWPADAAP